MTQTFSVHEAKSRLSHLISLAEGGESVSITRHGKVVALLSGANSSPRVPGSGVGTVEYLDDFEFTDLEISDLFDGDLPE
jgi:prevent-host-death family protein